MLGRALAPITLALLVGSFACFICAKPASTVPSGFSDAKVADAFSRQRWTSRRMAARS